LHPTKPKLLKNYLNILIQPWEAAQKAAYLIRLRVFVKEQSVPKHLELDEFDPIASHALAFINSECVGTGRLIQDGVQGQIGRMAVLPAFRGQGIGSAILTRLIDSGQANGIEQFHLHAQVSARSFYQCHGFTARGPVYEEAGILHQNMTL
jgi:predicted GNAT family N-acyltransferase